MAWEIEAQHLDLAEMEHVTTFVNRAVKNRHGEQVRYLLQIRLGDEITPNERGELVMKDGTVFDHKAKQAEVIAGLEERHRNALAFRDKHNIPLQQGPKS